MKWIDVDIGSIVKNRALFKQFILDYERHFGKLNIGCNLCIKDAHRKLVKKLNSRNMETPKYRLKKKYEGTFWKGNPIRNGDLTEQVAKDLIANHPAGKLLFDILPKEDIKEDKPVQEAPKVVKKKRKRTKK